MIIKERRAKNPPFLFCGHLKGFYFWPVTRQELKTALVQAYLWNPPYKKDHPLWKEALELYKKETGDNTVALGCGTCMNKIKNYLSK